MLDKQVISIFDKLDRPMVSGLCIKEFLLKSGADLVNVTTVKTEKGKTDFIEIWIYGKNGKRSGGNSKTLGIIGRLGGIGARPEMIGTVSDADGCVAALSVALKLSEMKMYGDILDGDIVVTTHICPDAPTQPHDPVPFMGSPVDMETNNKFEVLDNIDAFLSIDTTKGNNTLTHKGIMISPTVKDGYILRTSEDLITIMQIVTGESAKVFPLCTQDITPYSNGLWHLNSIMQPCTSTNSPVVGVAITSGVAVPGCATGASHLSDIEKAARFSLEVAKYFTKDKCSFYCEKEFQQLISLYGSMSFLKTAGKK